MITPHLGGIPLYLTTQNRWLLWRLTPEIEPKTGKTIERKIPMSGQTGKRCTVTDPHSWTDFARVKHALEHKTGAWDGPGFVLGPIESLAEVLIGLDLDSCLDGDDTLAPWAMPFLAAFASYAERSPGERGIKSVARIRASDLAAARKLLDIAEGSEESQARTRIYGATPPDGGHASGAQLFLMKRYFTITGRHWLPAPEDVTLLTIEQIATLGALFGPNKQRAPTRSQTDGADKDDAKEPEEAELRSKLDAAFGRNPRLRDRWEGGVEGLSDISRSGRDMSVVASLVTAGFTKGETHAALKLFEHGKLKEEEPRYFEEMWKNTKATPRVEPEIPPEWEAQHPVVVDVPSDQRQTRQRQRQQIPAAASLEAIWDPWEDPPPPAWPGNILPKEVERVLVDIALRDGIDPGAAAMTAITAASAAAPKDARLAPYRNEWQVPPIIWTMTIGDSGTRKTLLGTIGWSALRAVHAGLWRTHRAALKQWHNTPPESRGPKPEQPHSFIVDDVTPEALQVVLGNTMRGTAMIKDELAGLLEFSRYRNAGGEASRAFFLSCYEDAGVQVHRISRDNDFIEHTGLTIFGNIQPRRLAGFQQDMETDGLLQRFIVVRIGEAKLSQPDISVDEELATLHGAIRRLCKLPGWFYTVTPAGKDLIHQTEQLARNYASITDYGLGWPGFCFKLHGTHARLALILHMLSDLDTTEISTTTVESAHRLVHHFILQHARDFYASLPGGGRSLSQDIAGWLLTRKPGQSADEPERFLASDLTAGIRACRSLSSKGIGEVLDPFVTGGWLTPENDYPNNRAWFFNPALRLQFAERVVAERERRAALRALIGTIEENRGAQLS